jgi:hypothetical protein
MVWGIIIIAVLIAFASLAVDFGRVALAKTELQSAVDAAARAAVNKLAQGGTVAQARADAIYVAGQNVVDTSALALTTANIQTGNWNGTRFLAAGMPLNAVSVSTGRTAAGGNAVPLLFAQLLGEGTCDLHATSIAKFAPADVSGVIALNGMTLKNNAFFASYDSSLNPNPTHANATSNAAIGTNGVISGENNNEVRGMIVLGPSGSVVAGSITTTGGTNYLPADIPTPSLPPWAPQANPGGIPQNYTVSSNTTLPGGNYWFTSLTVDKNKTLSFSDTATLIVNGPIYFNGNVNAAGNLPDNLTIYQLGNNVFGDPDGNNSTITANIIAPGCDFELKNTLLFKGKMTFRTIILKNNADFYYDEASGAAATQVVSLVE